MSVFATALATLRSDANFRTAASFRRPPFAWESVYVTLSEPTDEIGNAIAGALQAEITAADITDTPQPGDELRIDTATATIPAGTVFTIHSPKRDAEGLSWRFPLSTGSQ